MSVPSKSANWPTGVTPAAQIVVSLFRSRNFIWDNDHRIVGRFGVTWTQFLTLSALRAASPDHLLSPTALYDATQASSGGMTKMLHGLSDLGYIDRIENPDDKRSRLVKLTPSGAKLAEDIVSKLIETNTALIGEILDEEETIMLDKLMGKLTQGLNTKHTNL